MTAVRTRRPRAWAVLVVAVLMSAGCVGIPTSGPIQDGKTVVEEPGLGVALANDPEVGAGPQQILTGFLSAGAGGLADEFVVARKFLTPAASAGWNPRAEVIVYPSGGPQFTEREDGSFLVTVPVSATVDSAGRFTEAVPGSRPRELVFELVRDVNDQWRISSLDDGVLMSAANFEFLYRPVAVYFASQDATHLVPDLRWFPTAKAPTTAANALLEGPSSWLRDAVRTGVPDGARLRPGAVTISSGVATLDLSPEASLAGEADRRLLATQLSATLERLPGVTDVGVTVVGVPWERATDLPLVRDPAPLSGPYVLQEDRLAVIDGQDVVPLDDAAPLSGLAANSPAISPDGSVRVVLSGTGRLVLLPPDAAAPVTLWTGTRLIGPSIDRLGWVWTGERASTGTLTVVDGAGQTRTVAAAWLDGRTVRSLRVSRDGARVVVVSVGSSPTDVDVDVAGIVRDEDGRPQSVSEEPLSIGASLTDATEVAWVDEVTVAVLGLSGSLSVPTMHLVPIGGPTQPLTLMEGTAGIAAGRGERALYLVDQDGVLLSRASNSWVTVATDVRDPVFPG